MRARTFWNTVSGPSPLADGIVHAQIRQRQRQRQRSMSTVIWVDWDQRTETKVRGKSQTGREEGGE
eukprot:2044154-Rhodomonas_salina.1